MSSRFCMVLAVAAGAGMLFSLGAMFGLGLLASPEKIQANGPSPYLTRMQAANDERRGTKDDRALTPIYPAGPKVAGADDAAVRQEAALTRQDAAAVPAAEPAATGALASTAGMNKCDVAACAAAYRSFRESDCTYQPFDGPRRLCTSPSAPAGQRHASEPREPKSPDAAISARSRTSDGNELGDVEAAVRRLTRDGDGFYPPPSMRDDGRRVIVIDRY